MIEITTEPSASTYCQQLVIIECLLYSRHFRGPFQINLFTPTICYNLYFSEDKTEAQRNVINYLLVEQAGNGGDRIETPLPSSRALGFNYCTASHLDVIRVTYNNLKNYLMECLNQSLVHITKYKLNSNLNLTLTIRKNVENNNIYIIEFMYGFRNRCECAENKKEI